MATEVPIRLYPTYDKSPSETYESKTPFLCLVADLLGGLVWEPTFGVAWACCSGSWRIWAWVEAGSVFGCWGGGGHGSD